MEDIPSMATRLNRVRNELIRDRHRVGLEAKDIGSLVYTKEVDSEFSLVWTQWSEEQLQEAVGSPNVFVQDARRFLDFLMEHRMHVSFGQKVGWERVHTGYNRPFRFVGDNHVTFYFANQTDLLLAKLIA